MGCTGRLCRRRTGARGRRWRRCWRGRVFKHRKRRRACPSRPSNRARHPDRLGYGRTCRCDRGACGARLRPESALGPCRSAANVGAEANECSARFHPGAKQRAAPVRDALDYRIPSRGVGEPRRCPAAAASRRGCRCRACLRQSQQQSTTPAAAAARPPSQRRPRPEPGLTGHTSCSRQAATALAEPRLCSEPARRVSLWRWDASAVLAPEAEAGPPPQRDRASWLFDKSLRSR